MKQIRQILALVLTALLATPYSGHAQQPSTARIPTIAVVDLAAPEREMDRRSQVRNAILESFSQDRRVRVVPMAAIQKWREREVKAQETQTPAEELRDARKFLAEGKKAYQHLKFNSAVKNLSEARREFILKLPTLRSNRDLIDAHLYLGVTYVAQKQNKKASDEFRRVVYLDPKRELSSKEFSPRVLDVFNKAKREVSTQESLAVRIESEPSGGTAYLNGRSLGVTPLETKLYPGEYFILVEKKGMSPWYKPVSFENRGGTVKATLQSTGEDASWARSFRVREGAGASNANFGPLLNMAASVGADFIFLGTIDRLRDYRLLGQLLDARTSELSQVAVLTASPEFESVPEAAPDMVETLLGFVRADGKLMSADNPDLNYKPEDLTVGGADRPPQNFVAPAPPKKWYERWWIYPLIAAAGVGVYFGVRNIGGTGGSRIAIDNRGNF